MINTKGRARRPLQRPQLTRSPSGRAMFSHSVPQSVNYSQPTSQNAALYEYEKKTKERFDRIEFVLREISAMQHDRDFIVAAQSMAKAELGITLPEKFLEDSWIKSPDIVQLYAWCVFETFKQVSDEFYRQQPLVLEDEQAFQQFLQSCGFHTLDVSPCADGRLAHVISYVLRLPYKAVRRKSYAGALFDVEDSLQKWIEIEMLRHREGRPNTATDATRYLKVAVYHFSSVKPDQEGCAAHGSNVERAAEAAKEKLQAFRQGVENSFCCGASIDLLLIGLDTDTDSIRIHIPDENGNMEVNCYIDTLNLYSESNARAFASDEHEVVNIIQSFIEKNLDTSPQEGMIRLIARIIRGNFQQVEYVKRYHQGNYTDIGHQERFIGMGIGFEEIQLRNLTYFSYLKTVEEGANDLDVGIKIFSGLNVRRGLPVPVVIRYDYHGEVPGARERAETRCLNLERALRQRYKELSDSGYIHTLLMVRDCSSDIEAEVIGCSVSISSEEAH